jgi:hypothetical protein
MPVDVQTHPNFGAAIAKFRASRDAATTAGDETALARADADWANDQSMMRADLYEKQDQERGRAAQIARIKAENPDVPDDVFENISDLDQAEKIAKSFQAVAGTRPRQTGQATQPGTWSPPPGGGGQGSSDPEDFVDPNEQRDSETGILPSIQRRMDKLAPIVMAKGALARQENQELQNASLEPVIARFQTKQR